MDLSNVPERILVRIKHGELRCGLYTLNLGQDGYALIIVRLVIGLIVMDRSISRSVVVFSDRDVVALSRRRFRTSSRMAEDTQFLHD